MMTDFDEHAGVWRAEDEMRPLACTLSVMTRASAALATLHREGMRFVVVIAGGRMAGVADRVSLAQFRACCHRSRGRCRVATHMAHDGGFCFGDEDVREVREAEREWVADVPGREARRLPLIVVDRGLRPLGHLPAHTESVAAGTVHHPVLHPVAA